ncbi:MAG: CusA/CzcA family heavy metal efflux RND transporter [Chromatiales bacterium]
MVKGNGGERRRTSLLATVIDFSARRPIYTLFIVLCLSLWGYRSLSLSPLDAIPDLSDVQVIVLTEWPGRSPDLVEDQITYPLTTSLLAAPKVQFVRGQSFMGLSFVYVIFDDDTDIYWARSRVSELLSTISHKLPEHARPSLGPDATGIGWVYQYALVDRTGRQDLSDLRALQDFSLRYWLESVPGVAEVASVGGYSREYQIQVDPYKLAHNGITLDQLIKAVRASNNDVGGRVLEIAGHEHFVRGRGYIHDKQDIEKIVIPSGMMMGGQQSVRLADVATVSLGPAMQRGLADLDGLGQAVGGIVVMRHGENALKVIEGVKQRLAEVQGGLPEGIEVVPVYDRSGLIERAIDTLKHALLEEMLAVAGILLLFLLHLRSALVAVITLPVAILLAFIPMGMQGVTANIMSLGGIAVAIGAMVDAAVVIIDNIHKRLQQEPGGRREVIIDAMREVGPSIFFSLLIITLSFLPVFALQGSEGRLFHPLAYTKTYAMAFAALLSVTLIPALAVLLIHGRPPRLQASLNNALMCLYRPLVGFCMRLRWWVLGTFCVALAATLPIASTLNSEFMPPLNEGSILYMPTSLPGMSITEAAGVLQSMDRELSRFPEVERVFGKMGRATTATDPAPLSMAEIVVTLKPQAEWRDGMSWDKLIEEMDEQLSYPGMPNIWWMPVQTRVEMLTTGIRSALGIKVFGDDLGQIETTAVAIERALSDDPRIATHTRSAFAERLTGGYFLDFDIKRDELARFGMNVDQVEKAIMAAVGGLPVTEVIEGRERYSVNLRYARDFRDDPQALERVLVPVSTMNMGQMEPHQIPISQVADIKLRTGPPMLRNEDGMLVGFVFVDVDEEIGIADYVEQARQVVDERVDVPAGYRIAWAGQYKHFERARDRLQILVPLTLFIVFFMLYLHRGSFGDALLVMSMVPFSLLGSVWLIYLLNYKLSVAVWVGMIAMAGLAAEMGLLMLFYLDHALRQAQAAGEVKDRAGLIAALTRGATQRIRPMLMTMLTLVASLVPVMLNQGTGSDVMKRIAAPMVGGILSTMLVVLLLMPALFALSRAWRAQSGDSMSHRTDQQ